MTRLKSSGEGGAGIGPAQRLGLLVSMAVDALGEVVEIPAAAVGPALEGE